MKKRRKGKNKVKDQEEIGKQEGIFVGKEKPQMVTHFLAVKAQKNTAVTQLSRWHSASCSMGVEEGLLKAQQQILLRTSTPT